MAELVTLLIGVLGVSGVIFTALRWRRDDTTAVVNQQATLFEEMRGITDNLRLDRDELRSALDECEKARGT